MTRTISLITAIVGAALLFAVPASADSWAADRHNDSVGYLNPDSGDRAAALEQQRVAQMLDSREKSQTAKLEAQLLSKPYPDVFERAATAAGDSGSQPYPDVFERAANALGESGPGVFVDDRFALHAQAAPQTATATSTKWDLDFGQVGLGFGIGILLATGLALAVRYTRLRLAH